MGERIKPGPADALLVVDVQNCFLPGGSLAVKDGDRVIPVLNRLIPRFATVIYSRDWHPPGHCSFAAEPRFVDQSWPEHCLQNTPGAEFHHDLLLDPGAIVIGKGADPKKEAYSAFDGAAADGRTLAAILASRGVSRLFIGGLATDYCVRFSVLDALGLGLAAVVVADAVRGVDVPAGQAEAALAEMRAAGALIVPSAEIE
jgi:nicotinamidase/pyrazinamidase